MVVGGGDRKGEHLVAAAAAAEVTVVLALLEYPFGGCLRMLAEEGGRFQDKESHPFVLTLLSTSPACDPRKQPPKHFGDGCFHWSS